jgi:hypothetical protein
LPDPEKLAETLLGPNGAPIKRPLVVPKGVDPTRYFQASKAKAALNTTTTPGGSVLVDCPYCIIYWRRKNPVDVTRFVDRAGKREVKTACSKGHVLVFRSIDNWREERQRMGLQRKA